MNTKIIYISGNEVFDMADIRAAFDSVRTALGLGNDTVLFGVPVDRDNALDKTNNTCIDINTDITPTETIDEIIPCTAPEVTPKQKKPRSRAIKEITPTADETPINDTVTDTPIVEEAASPEEDKVIPILSILAAKSEEPIKEETTTTEDVIDDETPTTTEEDATNEYNPETELDEDVAVADAEISDTVVVTSETVVQIETETVTIDSDAMDDMVNDDTPMVTAEKTLEQLLESMTPLREDMDEHFTKSDNADDMETNDATTDSTDDAVINDNDGTDATLEQLAAEFAENQDAIAPAPRTETQGRIGKLKNILPFKKARRDDSGLMGDLFGWAGIAANDEDFAIPGFFTNAVGKK